MKNLSILLMIAALFYSCASSSKVQEQSKADTEYRILWGVAESENYNRSSRELQAYRDSLRAERRNHSIDTSQYEVKNYLWGAIKFTTKKEND